MNVTLRMLLPLVESNQYIIVNCLEDKFYYENPISETRTNLTELEQYLDIPIKEIEGQYDYFGILYITL